MLFAVKLWDTEKAAELAQPLVGPNTRVITLQNGIDSVERIAPILGADRRRRRRRLYRHRDRRARRHQAHQPVRHHAFRPRRQEAGRRCSHAFAAAGKAAKLDIDISRRTSSVERWEKFIFLTAMAGSTASRALRRSARSSPIRELRGFFRALMEEAAPSARPRASRSAPTYIEQRMDFSPTKVEPGMKASMAHDLERGNRLELDWLNGKVRALGRELNVPTPASDAVYTVLKLHRMGRD